MKTAAVTACPTGIAHTYMAAAILEKTAKNLKHEIKVKTQGVLGRLCPCRYRVAVGISTNHPRIFPQSPRLIFRPLPRRSHWEKMTEFASFLSAAAFLSLRIVAYSFFVCRIETISQPA